MSSSVVSGASPIMSDGSASQAVQPLLGTAVSFIVINTIFLILRFYTVLFLRRKQLGLKWDDYFLLPAYLFISAVAILALIMRHYEGGGNPPYSANEEIMVLDRLEPILKCIWAILLVLVAGYAFTRYSILAFYLRVFTNRWMRWLSYFFIAFITCQWIAFNIATILQCDPVSFYWDKTILDGHCVDIEKFNRSFTPVNIAADCVILLMPLPLIWKLQASKLRKAGYTLILGMGAFALAASIVRAVVLDSHSTTVITPYISNLEIEWLVIEPSLYFITACLPTMHPLFRLLTPLSLRRATESKIAQARHNRAPSFARLADDDPGVQRERVRAGTKTHSGKGPLGAAGGMPESEVGATAVGRTQRGMGRERGPLPGSVPMQDLRQMEAGERIIVHTEIIVSQEERMESVMGF